MKSPNSSTWQRLRLLLAATLLAALANTAWAAVGQFQFVSGDVRITSPDGRERQAQKGGEINEGESVISAKGATAQLRMTDGGIIAIRQETQMRIDEYKFNGQEDGSERSFFSLVKGGFRSITGTVGKLHKENYRIKTPSATIGIRGTDSETTHVTTDTRLPGVPAGTYNRVNTGATVVNGTLVHPNQVAYTPNLNTAGVLLPKMPPIFEPPKTSAKPAPQKTENKSETTTAPTETAASSGTAPTPTTDATTETPPPLPPPPAATAVVLASAALPPPPPPTTAVVGSTASTSGVTSTGGVYPAPIGYGGVGGDISWRTECPFAGACYTGWLSGGGSVVLEANTNRSILLDGGGFPVLIATSDTTGSMQYTAGTASLLDSGQTVAAGTTVRWGRYVGADSFVDNDGTRDPLVMNLMWAESSLSYTQAQAALASVTTPVNFNLVSAAGTVIDDLNNVYHLASGSLQVASGGANITLQVITDTVATRSWDLTYQSTSGALSQFYQATATTGPSGIPLIAGSIKINGATVATTVKGNASGIFIGSTATGALASFSANALPAAGLTSGAALSGTALLVR